MICFGIFIIEMIFLSCFYFEWQVDNKCCKICTYCHPVNSKLTTWHFYQPNNLVFPKNLNIFVFLTVTCLADYFNIVYCHISVLQPLMFGCPNYEARNFFCSVILTIGWWWGVISVYQIPRKCDSKNNANQVYYPRK